MRSPKISLRAAEVVVPFASKANAEPSVVVAIARPQEETRLSNGLERLKFKLGGVVRAVKMALAITGSLARAFAADEDPDYRGLLGRAIFSEVRMREGTIVGARQVSQRGSA
jgi:hypothetical protein